MGRNEEGDLPIVGSGGAAMMAMREPTNPGRKAVTSKKHIRCRAARRRAAPSVRSVRPHAFLSRPGLKTKKVLISIADAPASLASRRVAANQAIVSRYHFPAGEARRALPSDTIDHQIFRVLCAAKTPSS